MLQRDKSINIWSFLQHCSSVCTGSNITLCSTNCYTKFYYSLTAIKLASKAGINIPPSSFWSIKGNSLIFSLFLIRYFYFLTFWLWSQCCLLPLLFILQQSFFTEQLLPSQEVLYSVELVNIICSCPSTFQSGTNAQILITFYINFMTFQTIPSLHLVTPAWQTHKPVRWEQY